MPPNVMYVFVQYPSLCVCFFFWRRPYCFCKHIYINEAEIKGECIAFTCCICVMYSHPVHVQVVLQVYTTFLLHRTTHTHTAHTMDTRIEWFRVCLYTL